MHQKAKKYKDCPFVLLCPEQYHLVKRNCTRPCWFCQKLRVSLSTFGRRITTCAFRINLDTYTCQLKGNKYNVFKHHCQCCRNLHKEINFQFIFGTIYFSIKLEIKNCNESKLLQNFTKNLKGYHLWVVLIVCTPNLYVSIIAQKCYLLSTTTTIGVVIRFLPVVFTTIWREITSLGEIEKEIKHHSTWRYNHSQNV